MRFFSEQRRKPKTGFEELPTLANYGSNEFFLPATAPKFAVLPTIGKCGEALNISESYLSDLLRLETGRSAKDHIHDFIIEKQNIVVMF